MKLFLLLVALPVLLISSIRNNSSSEPTKCLVVFRPEGCDYFMCMTPGKDYIVMEWYGGNDPDKGDVLYGSFEDFGFKNGYNLTQKKKLRVWIEDYMLSKSDAIDKLLEHCD
jgi:hypothetical protein